MDTIKVEEIRQAIDGLFRFIIEDLGVTEVPLQKDYYWNVPLDQAYRLEAPADEIGKELDVGSLVADIQSLQKSVRDKPTRVAFQLTHAAALLRYIGEAAEEERLKKSAEGLK